MYFLECDDKITSVRCGALYRGPRASPGVARGAQRRLVLRWSQLARDDEGRRGEEPYPTGRTDAMRPPHRERRGDPHYGRGGPMSAARAARCARARRAAPPEKGRARERALTLLANVKGKWDRSIPADTTGEGVVPAYLTASSPPG